MTTERLVVDLQRRHVWDGIRTIQMECDNVHESVFRSWHVLQKAREMLERGDSPPTVIAFIQWAYSEPTDAI